MVSIELLGAEDIAQNAYVGVLYFLPRLDNLHASLIHVPEAQNPLQIVYTIGLDIGGLVADRLVAECARLVFNVYLLTVERHQILVVLHLARQLFNYSLIN